MKSASELRSGKGRKDESGDFTHGAGLTEESAIRVMSIFEARGVDNKETCDRLDGGPQLPRVRQEGADELRQIAKLVSASGYDGRDSGSCCKTRCSFDCN